jgi:hypothetical protein
MAGRARGRVKIPLLVIAAFVILVLIWRAACAPVMRTPDGKNHWRP